MNLDRITERVVVAYQLEHGWTPRQILVEHYDRMIRQAKTASDISHLREARNEVAAFGFIKNLIDMAKQTELSLKDLIVMFKDSKVVKFFKEIGWSFKYLYDLLKDGMKVMKDLRDSLLEYAEQSSIGKWTMRQLDSQTLKDIDNWLKKNPKTKRWIGYGVAALLVYLWFNMSFMGNPEYDFDFSDVLGAMAGSYSFADIFSGAEGLKLLLLFFTGSLIGISFPWPGPTNIQFAVSILYSLAKKLGKKLSKSKDTTEQEVEDLGLEAVPA